MEHEGIGDTTCGWCTQDNPQRIGKGTGRLGNKRTNGDHPDYSIIKIGQNTEKSTGDLRRLAVTPNTSEKLSANGGMKNSQMSKKKMIMIKLFKVIQ